MPLERTSSGGIGPSRLWLILITIVMFLPSLSASAQNHYYVSVSGNDSNSGASPSTAWRTINHAISAFSLGSGGAVIHVADGTYSNVSVNRGGSSPTVRLVIQCDNGLASSLVAKGHCKFPGSDFAWTLTGGSNFDIRGMDIGGNPDQRVAINGIPCGSAGHSACLDSVHIVGNYIHDLNQTVPVDANGCNIRGTGPAAILILNHHFMYVDDLQVTGNFIKNFGPPNYPLSCNASNYGMYIDTQNATIENNVIVHVGVFGIQNYGQPCGTRISNNTFINAHFAMTVSGDGEGICTPGKVTINNNIMVGMKKGAIGQISQLPCTDSAHQSFFGNNISDGTVSDFVNAPPASCNTTSPSTFVHASGASLFVNYQTDGTGDYHLKADSGVVGAGTTQCVSGGTSPCVPTFDLAGFTRTNTPTPGAFEPSSSSASAPAAPSGLTARVQ
jgi:hypothetical protein